MGSPAPPLRAELTEAGLFMDSSLFFACFGTRYDVL
jgi:hypothetical protein